MNPYIKHLSQLFNKSMRSLAGEDYRNKSYLVALSAGSDSMALAQLSIMNGMKIAIAHCNYMLRGEESNGDENMVINFFENLNIPVYIKQFDTKTIAHKEKQSIQLIARKLRYDFFYELAEQHQFDFILTGHHFDDKIETFIINLGRGSGLKGLKGIPPCNGKIIRPLLSYSKEDLLSFCKILHIPFRDDSSNLDSKYKRNFVRNEALPLMASQFPGFKENVGVTMNIINEYYKYVQKKVEAQLEICTKPHDYGSKLLLDSLTDKELTPFIVREYLEKRTFSMSDTDDMIHALSINKSGIKLIGKDGSIAISDRQKIIYINKEIPDFCFDLNLKDGFMDLWFGRVTIRKVEDETMKIGENQYLLNVSKLEEKIIIRSKHDGDKIRSLGMNGSFQKLQDVYTNAKLDYLEKRLQPVFVKNSGIFWVPGLKRSQRNINSDHCVVYILEIS